MTYDARLTPARPDIAAAHLAGTVTAGRFVEGSLMTVSAPVLDLMSVPDPDAGLASQLLMGEGFVAYELDTATGLAWGQAVADGYVGYVPIAGLEAGARVANAQVVADTTQTYPEGQLKTRPLDGLPFLAQLTLLPGDGAFRELATGGFCPAAHLGPPGAMATDLVSVAERFLGVPYVWGGRSSYGFDCSGLVQIAFQATGIAAPRDSDMQSKMGREIAPDEGLLRGDLIFWTGHVGIMQDAERLIHATANAMAVVSEPLASVNARVIRIQNRPVIARRRL